MAGNYFMLSPIEKLQSIFLNAPHPGLTEHKEYQLWEDDIKVKHPIKYFMFFTIGNKFDDISYDINKRLKDIKYWFLYRLHPKYRSYWMVKPKTLNIGYHDPDYLMLHTNMHIITEFYEDIINDRTSTDWDYDEKYRNAKATMKEIYEWWNIQRPLQEKTIENLYNQCYDLNLDEMFNDDRESKERLHNSNVYKKVNEVEEYINTKDTEMLHKLVDIRNFLWD